MSSAQEDVANRSLIAALELRLMPRGGISAMEFLNLQKSARVGMLRIFRDQLTRPIGYIAWAMIDRASLGRLLKYGRYPAYQHEWKEGGVCLILDVLVASRGRCEAISSLREFVRGQRAVVYARDGETPRVLIRRRGRLRTQNVGAATNWRLMEKKRGAAMLVAAECGGENS